MAWIHDMQVYARGEENYLSGRVFEELANMKIMKRIEINPLDFVDVRSILREHHAQSGFLLMEVVCWFYIFGKIVKSRHYIFAKQPVYSHADDADEVSIGGVLTPYSDDKDWKYFPYGVTSSEELRRYFRLGEKRMKVFVVDHICTDSLLPITSHFGW